VWESFIMSEIRKKLASLLAEAIIRPGCYGNLLDFLTLLKLKCESRWCWNNISVVIFVWYECYTYVTVTGLTFKSTNKLNTPCRVDPKCWMNICWHLKLSQRFYPTPLVNNHKHVTSQVSPTFFWDKCRNSRLTNLFQMSDILLTRVAQICQGPA